MYYSAFERRSRGHIAAAGLILETPNESVELGRERECRHYPVGFALANRDVGEIGGTEPHRGFADGAEHRLQIEGRAADDLEHIARRGLVLERFFEVVRA